MSRDNQLPPTKRTAAGLAGMTCLFLVAGCVPENPAAKAATPAETFRAPSPRDAQDDPRVAEPKSKGDAIAASLASIHEQLRDMQLAYQYRAKIEGDLKDMADRMRPLIEESRAHCDAMARAAEDLRAQLPHAQAGYVVAGASYRQRAEGYRDTDLKAMTLKLADQFDWMASETPRRLELVDKFLKELHDAQDFLAETERCVRDTAAALAVFSAHAKVPEMPVDARAFSRRLGEFIAVAREYEAKLINTPAPPTGQGIEDPSRRSPAPPARMRQDPSPAATNTSSPQTPEHPASEGQRSTLKEAHVVWASKLTLRPAAPVKVIPAYQDPLPVGIHLSGEITNPSYSFRNHVSLTVLDRSGEYFSGVVRYEHDYAKGRRGVRGRISPDGRTLTFKAEWFEGNLSPEEVRYELRSTSSGFEGTWSSQSLRGTILLLQAPS